MRPEFFDGSDVVLGVPGNWDADVHGPCEGLPVIRRDGVCISCWGVSWRERLSILIGRPVWLHVVSGNTQPPVALTVGDHQ